MGCYCEDRKNNPKIAELMRDIPEGFCGVCDVCGSPGHTRAHPSLPVSGAWCDEHWAELVAPRRITPDRLMATAILAIALAAIGLSLWRSLR
jgi:hypothetical protein